MQIKTALILCAGFGKRLNPLTLDIPKPLIQLKDKTMLENCINLIIKLGIKKIILNTFYLDEKINDFINKKKFPIEIQIIKDGEKILNTGGGIKKMMMSQKDSDYLIFNPDTVWNEKYIQEINKMQEFYFSRKLDNLLLLVKKNLSFDINLLGDFSLKNNLIKKDDRDYIFIGCQILNKDLLKNFDIKNFSISEVWNKQLKNQKLNGFESYNEFFHLTDFEIFKKLKDL